MLRRRLSAGALRAAAQLQQSSMHTSATVARMNPTSTANTAKANINPHGQSASLASGVLLGTQRTWKTETVNTLKAELKRRGLSQQGNKATLVARLTSAETSSMLPPMPPTRVPAAPRRTLSTSPPRQAETPPSPEKIVGVQEDVSKASGDVDIHARVEVKKVEVTPEIKSSAPGLPLKPRAPDQWQQELSMFNVKFPEPKIEKEAPQIIPTTPDNFTVRSKEEDSTPLHTGPKVLTVASAVTHHAIPVAGEADETADPRTATGAVSSDPSSTSGSDSPKSASKSESKDDSPKSDSSGKAKSSSVSGFLCGAVCSLAKEANVHLPKGEPEIYKASSRPLNDEERKGAWALAAVAATVVFIGTLTSGPGKKQVDKVAAKVEEKAGEVKDKVEKKAGEVKDKVEKKAGEVKDKVKDKV